MRKQIYQAIRPAAELAKERGIHPLIGSRTGLTPITTHDPQDVFVVGYPKSGNTWYQNLVSGVMFGVNPLLAPDTLIQELAPDVHYKRYYKRFWTPMFFKSHRFPQEAYRRVIYLVRDGRDALVSYYHYRAAMTGVEPDFARMVATGEGIMGRWHEHVEAWLANPYGAEMMLVRYEDLQQDTVTELERLCAFAGVERDRTWLEQVASAATFDKMRNKEKSGRYFREDPDWPEDKLFNRRGVVGSYKDEMPPDILALFMRDAGNAMARLGYV